MHPVTCRTCGNRVLAEKYSPVHTSIQWLTDAARSCARFRADAEHGRPALHSCADLRETVDDLADRGELPITARSRPTPGRLD
ncbi:hypothetical protein QM787_16355 [Rhodococcus ruber]|uniref:Uncharacterized protein n=1 Tax=Rhodococcus ruber TaxID=1830 RepID=A0A098BH62_9NOCA|nr:MULTISPECIES: hypothetical protein [Rhodococcus]RIK11848.1 MAG: hypothetical protein DCC47_09485 [Acidobacteriota bacterium]AUM18090.1 hypothetical protein CSW53_17080 [Rhodococcus ruber]AXY53788.1 hypothetical protein YT1_4397 [Rhodococcus ruber]MBP2213052.1 hypothetical protein [Rhodococcus ruber]MCD2127389.1 hypothetical protein [Rhodococcus ruber]